MKKILFIVLLCSLIVNAYSLSIKKYEFDAKLDSSLQTISVSEEIYLSGSINTDTSIYIQAIQFGQERISPIQVSMHENRDTLTMTKNESGLLASKIVLHKSGHNNHKLSLNYKVDHQATRLQIPVIFVSVKPNESKDELFAANIFIPSAYQLSESFPTSADETDHTSTHRLYKINLQAIPSMLELKIDKEKRFYVGRTLWVDIIVILLLLGISCLIWIKRKIVV